MRKGSDRSIVKLKEIAEIIMGQSPKSEFYGSSLFHVGSWNFK
jgi:hypothetical protein